MHVLGCEIFGLKHILKQSLCSAQTFNCIATSSLTSTASCNYILLLYKYQEQEEDDGNKITVTSLGILSCPPMSLPPNQTIKNPFKLCFFVPMLLLNHNFCVSLNVSAIELTYLNNLAVLIMIANAHLKCFKQFYIRSAATLSKINWQILK